MDRKLLIGFGAALGALIAWQFAGQSETRSLHRDLDAAHPGAGSSPPTSESAPLVHAQGSVGADPPAPPNAGSVQSEDSVARQPGNQISSQPLPNPNILFRARFLADRPGVTSEIDQRFLAESATDWGSTSGTEIDLIMLELYPDDSPPPYSRECRETICYMEVSVPTSTALDLYSRVVKIRGEDHGFLDPGFMVRLGDEDGVFDDDDTFRFWFFHPDFRL